MTRSITSPGSMPGTSLYRLYVGALGVCLAGNLLIRVGARGGWIPQWGEVALGVASAAPLAIAAIFFWRLLRRDLDEMLQRVVLEGLAFAFVVYVPLAGLYVNLRTASSAWTPHLDAPDLLLTPALLAALGMLVAWRRLQ